MTASKSPFIIIEQFISPLLCEEIIDTVSFPDPIEDDNKDLIPTYTKDAEYEQIIYDTLKQYLDGIESHYDFTHELTEAFSFEYLPPSSHIGVHAENAENIENQWVRTKARDFTGVLFLSEYNSGNESFDDTFEVQGGNLEFLNHGFSIHPSPGTLVIFPSDPRFANASSKVLNGEAYQVRFHLAGKQPYIYDPKQFPGNFETWF